MNSIMDRWYEAASKRSSVREYNGKAFSEEVIKSIKDLVHDLENENENVRLQLLTDINVFKTPFFMNSINGTKYSVAVIAINGAEQEAGSIGEAFALECTACNIGTCWISGSYNKSIVRKHVMLKNNEALMGIIAFGHTDTLLKARTKGKKRPEELAECTASEFRSLPEWQQAAAKCAAIAPTARNKQEFEIEFKANSVKIYPTSNNMGFVNLDCGIAMLHIEIAAAHYGVYGTWSEKKDGFIFSIV